MAGGIMLVDGMLQVEAGRSGTKLKGGGVLLRMKLQPLYLFGSLTCTEYQDACGQGIKGACMTYLHPLDAQSLREDVTDMSQRTEACHPVGLVDIDICALLEIH